ncbi:MAG: FIST N-terminal domain-containing protein, partial [Algisphaera sp.]
MISHSFQYTTESGWSCESFPDLDSPSTVVLVFGASHHPDLALQLTGLREAYPSSVLMGCSSAGEIWGEDVYDDTLSVAVMRFDHTPLRFVSAPLIEGDSAGAGALLAESLAAEDLKAVLVLSPGLGVNGSLLTQAFNQSLSPTVRVVGGLAADGDRFEKTWVIEGGQAVSDRITAVGFYGDHVCVGSGSGAGWDPFGPERRITRSEGNVLFELDGQPALAVYERYLGDLAEGLPGSALLFPLSVNRPGREDAAGLVRTVLAVDREVGSMTLAGDVPEGSRAQLMRCRVDRLVDGAEVAGKMALTC